MILYVWQIFGTLPFFKIDKSRYVTLGDEINFSGMALARGKRNILFGKYHDRG